MYLTSCTFEAVVLSLISGSVIGLPFGSVKLTSGLVASPTIFPVYCAAYEDKAGSIAVSVVEDSSGLISHSAPPLA